MFTKGLFCSGKQLYPLPDKPEWKVCATTQSQTILDCPANRGSLRASNDAFLYAVYFNKPTI